MYPRYMRMNKKPKNACDGYVSITPINGVRTRSAQIEYWGPFFYINGQVDIVSSEW